jgi:hypothetical protein
MRPDKQLALSAVDMLSGYIKLHTKVGSVMEVRLRDGSLSLYSSPLLILCLIVSPLVPQGANKVESALLFSDKPTMPTDVITYKGDQLKTHWLAVM